MFLNVEFTRSISFHRTGGSAFNTSVITMSSGQEQRNANWSVPRAKYIVSTITPITENGVPITPTAYVALLRNFFLAAQGKLNSFYYWDPLIQSDIPVRFDTDEFNVQVEPSDVAGGNPIISWNSLALVEVLPPNY